MNKYTICIINENNNVSIRGLYDKHIDALNNIIMITKNYVKEITLEQDVIIKTFDKSLDEIKYDAPDGCYFLKNENNGCCLYKKEIEQNNGILSYVYSSGTPIIKKIAQIMITNFDMPENNKNENKENSILRLELYTAQADNVCLKKIINELEEKNNQLKESVRVLRADKSKLQEEIHRKEKIIVETNTVDGRKNTLIKEIKTKTGNLSYIEEMMSFLNSQVCEPQQLIQPSKLAEMKRKIKKE